MKELKVQTEALAHPQAPIAVESGEGIERGKSWFPSPISGGGVESGEGIESHCLILQYLLAVAAWNPVKELKAAHLPSPIMNSSGLWNPVKELKVKILLAYDE